MIMNLQMAEDRSPGGELHVENKKRWEQGHASSPEGCWSQQGWEAGPPG